MNEKVAPESDTRPLPTESSPAAGDRPLAAAAELPEPADVRSRLIAAAGPIFAEKGFDGASIRDICAAADDANVASVGYYFGDKLGLYRDVIRAIRDSRERRFPIPQREDLDPRITLFRLVHTMLSRMLAADSSGWESQLLMREMQQPTPVFESIVREFFEPLYHTLIDTLSRIVSEETQRHELEQLALSVAGQCVYYRCGSGVVKILITEANRKANYDIDSLSRHITSVTLAAAENRRLAGKKAELDRLLSEASILSTE